MRDSHAQCVRLGISELCVSVQQGEGLPMIVMHQYSFQLNSSNNNLEKKGPSSMAVQL